MGTVSTFLAPAVIPAAGTSKVFVIENYLDFKATPVAAADVVQALSVKDGWMVLTLAYEVITAEGATCTATIGDDGSANRFAASANLNSGAGTKIVSAASTLHVYNADNTIDLTMGHDTDAAQLRIWALCVDFNAQP